MSRPTGRSDVVRGANMIAAVEKAKKLLAKLQEPNHTLKLYAETSKDTIEAEISIHDHGLGINIVESIIAQLNADLTTMGIDGDEDER